MDHIIRTISYGPYHMVHIAWAISYVRLKLDNHSFIQTNIKLYKSWLKNIIYAAPVTAGAIVVAIVSLSANGLAKTTS